MSGNKGKRQTWTEERVKLLEKLWQQGLSASEIARVLGDGISRNAVIGKVHRLGLPGRAPSRTAGSRRRAPAGNATTAPRRPSRSVARGGSSGAAATALKAAAEPAPTPAAATAEVVTTLEKGRIRDIMDLKRTSCRWPIGDPGDEDFAYCGARAVEGLPYCEHHARIAYQNSEKRRANG